MTEGHGNGIYRIQTFLKNVFFYKCFRLQPAGPMSDRIALRSTVLAFELHSSWKSSRWLATWFLNWYICTRTPETAVPLAGIVVSNMDSWRKLWTFFMSLELAECKEWDDARSKWKRRGGKRMFFPPFCSSSLQKKWSNFFSLSPTIGRSATARLGIVNLVSCAVKHFCHKRLRRDEKRKKRKSLDTE
jgi:hypothetical protein